jgi:hypothetical protein
MVLYNVLPDREEVLTKIMFPCIFVYNSAHIVNILLKQEL